MTKNKAFGYLLESKCLEKVETKNCLSAQFKNDTSSPMSDLSVILTNNCHLIFCVNFHTIFSLATYLSEAVFKETVETEYYRDFAEAALNKIDQYVQLGIAMAV